MSLPCHHIDHHLTHLQEISLMPNFLSPSSSPSLFLPSFDSLFPTHTLLPLTQILTCTSISTANAYGGAAAMQAYPYGATAMAGYGGAYNMAAGTFFLTRNNILYPFNFYQPSLSISPFFSFLSLCVSVFPIDENFCLLVIFFLLKLCIVRTAP